MWRVSHPDVCTGCPLEAGTSHGCSGYKGHACPSGSCSGPWSGKPSLMTDCPPRIPSKSLQPGPFSEEKPQVSEHVVYGQVLSSDWERRAGPRMWQICPHTWGHVDEMVAPCKGKGHPADTLPAVEEIQHAASHDPYSPAPWLSASPSVPSESESNTVPLSRLSGCRAESPSVQDRASHQVVTFTPCPFSPCKFLICPHVLSLGTGWFYRKSGAAWR